MPETQNLVDRILALAVGGVAFALLCVWPFPDLHPTAWNDVATAAGVIPSAHVLSGLGLLVSKTLFDQLPFPVALNVCGWLAKAAVALCGTVSFFLFSGMMEAVSGAGAHDWRRRRLAIRIASLVAALLFVGSDPMWRAAQGFTGPTVTILLAVTSLAAFVRTLQTANPSLAAGSLALTGLLAAESPLGWFLLVLEIGTTVRCLRLPIGAVWLEFMDSVSWQRAKWTMSFSFAGAFLVGLLAEMFSFAAMDGLRAAGLTVADLPWTYLQAYWGRLTGSMSVLGLCLLVVGVIIPFALTTVMAASATDEDRYLPFVHSVVYFVCGLSAFLSLAPWAFLWLWNVLGPDAFASEPLLLFICLLDSVTVAWAVYVLGIEALCRDYDRVEDVHVTELGDADDEPTPRRGSDDEDVRSVRLSFARLVPPLVPLALVAVCIWGRQLNQDRELCSLLWDFVRETVVDATGTKYLFTDGAFDSALRLEIRRRGLDIVPVSLSGGTAPRDAYLRQSGTAGADDRATLAVGAAEALRTWVQQKPARLASVAVQHGLELLKLNGELKPIAYGTVVRPSGGDASAAAKSVDRGHRLAVQVVDAHERGLWRTAKDRRIRELFLFAQFRLADLSRRHALELDVAGNAPAALAETANADRLDACNPSCAEIARQLDWVRRPTAETLTPREGLDVALKRSDFGMARRYALQILKEDPDEPDANFAMGMGYYGEELFSQAEAHLRRVLKQAPKRAAAYGGLAKILLKTGRLDEAETNAVRALEFDPKSTEARDTISRIRKAQSARKTKGRRP